jgi:hypothetical protein
MTARTFSLVTVMGVVAALSAHADSGDIVDQVRQKHPAQPAGFNTASLATPASASAAVTLDSSDTVAQAPVPLTPQPGSPVAGGPATPSPAPLVSGDIVDQVLSTPAPGPAGSPPASQSSENALPMGLRIEGGLGYNNGGTDTTVSVPGTGSASTNLLGGGGVAAEAAIWADDMLMPTLSLGTQYLYFGDSGSVTASSSAGPVFGLTSATANLSLTTNAVMFDAAWRPSMAGIHPFLGAGIGVAFTTLSGSALGFSASNSQIAAAAQAFLGFDYDITSNIYVGVTGRFFISKATYHAAGFGVPSNIDITNRPISLMAHLGARF